jgi:hypothetical protein
MRVLRMVAKKTLLERISGGLAFSAVALLICGNESCYQKSYEIASQATTAVPTATPTATRDAATPEPTVSGTTTPNPNATPTNEPTPDLGDDGSDPSVDQAVVDDTSADLLQELSKAGEDNADEAAGTVARSASANGNWLGKNFAKGGDNSVEGEWVDTDGDGFSDDFENAAGSDPVSPTDYPEVSPNWSSYKTRVRTLDKDLDGLSDEEERKLATNPNVNDTDGDNRPDGAEMLSGGDPKRAVDRYLDLDGDGLSDDYENEQGLNPASLDSDGDGLRDDLELVLGANPLKVDTDGDGIKDGREFDLGTDPTVADQPQQ